MAKAPLPSPEELRQLLRYDPETGNLHWLPRGPEWFPDTPRRNNVCAIWNSAWSGKEAFTASSGPGRAKTGNVRCHQMLAHRVAWAIYHGAYPVHAIDHVNGDPTDNRIANLRDVPMSINSKNLRRKSSNTTGVTGVWRRRGKWSAEIMIDRKKIALGVFDTLEAAAAARLAAEEGRGFTASHGRR